MVQGLDSENRCDHKGKWRYKRMADIQAISKMPTKSDFIQGAWTPPRQLPPLFSIPLLFYSTNTEMVTAS